MENIIPQDFINQVKSNIERELNVTDAQMINHGPLSVLTNLLVNLQYDAKTYSDFMFREFNIATATQLSSMLFHAGVYGYVPKYASPATAQLVIIIPVPNLSNDKIVTYTIPAYTRIDLNSVPYRFTGKITISCTSDSVSAKYEHTSESRKLNTSRITIDNKDYYSIVVDKQYVVQLERFVEKFVVPQYNIGDNVNYEIQLPALPYRYKVLVNYNKNNSFDTNLLLDIDLDSISGKYPYLEEYQIRQFKNSSTPFTKCVFMNILDDYSHIKLTLGNNVYGYKLNMNDEVIFVSDVTLGDAGNIQPCETTINNVEQVITDSATGNVVSVINVNLKSVVPHPASGGKRPDDVEEIRKNILELLTTRNSLSTLLDFKKEFMNDDLQYATVLSKKIDLFNPVVQVYNVYKTLYEKKIVPQKTVNYTDPAWDKIPDLVEFPELENMISPFIYIKNNSIMYSYKMKAQEKIVLNPVNIIERHDIVPNLYIYFRYSDKKYHIKCDGLPGEVKATFVLDSNEIVLDESNGFQYELTSQKYVDNRYPLDALHISDFKIVDAGDDHLMHVYDINSAGIEVISRIQKHKIYGDNKILNMPFIDKQFFETTIARYTNECNNFYHFFNKVPEILDDGRMIFNVDINYCLVDTTGINDVVLKYATINEYQEKNIELSSPKLPVDIKIIFDNNKLYESGVLYSDFTNEVKLAIYSYLLSREGTKIEFYRTDLVKYIKNIYPDIILEAIVSEPMSLATLDFNYMMNLWTENDSPDIEKILDLQPSYFHFDIENSNIAFQNLSNQ